ncbi:hypothetical protein DCCM_0343 [Desulfocucumis palustris]|uniref:Uncharacterized protein n=1 Tax=Desulfocucumis palustris TaxID=1898651 RepID=A0A2L2X831_9FIRM|nr:hypothetical protein [Desulfocucumis palustris]GBF32152.1 hypothetical protein DCCM_0343 [Desulfocucumis palustris]
MEIRIYALALIVALVAGVILTCGFYPAILETGKTTPAVLEDICRELTRRCSGINFDITAASVAVGCMKTAKFLVLSPKACFRFRR